MKVTYEEEEAFNDISWLNKILIFQMNFVVTQ